MSFATVIFKKVFGFVHSFLACFRRLLCFLKIRSKEPESLPFTVSSSIPDVPDRQPVFYENLPTQQLPNEIFDSPETETWDRWDEKLGSSKIDRIQAYRERVAREREEMERRKSNSMTENEQPEINLFQELEPKVKKSKKILIRNHANKDDLGNRFNVQSQPIVPEASRDLGDLEMEDGGENSEAWDFDESSLDVDSVMKEGRRREREERKSRRHAYPPSGKGSSGLEAVKISMN